MKWTLKEIKQETNHKFLNYFTLVYQIDDGKKVFDYEYYMVSRRSKDELLTYTHLINKPDGVLIPLYYLDYKNKEVKFLLTRQYRPCIGTYLTSFTAGLLEKDESIFDAVKREVKEESGAIVDDIEILAPSSPSSACISDEITAVALARIIDFKETNLEYCEDITTSLYTIKEIKKMLIDKNYIFPANIRILLLYLLERFKSFEF